MKYLLLSLLILSVISSTSGVLKLVQILFRHGDRAPIETYPTDPNKEYWRPIGLGMLTKKGMLQQYDLGRYIRTRYQGYLSTTWKSSEINVRSTDMDRTLMSALANMAGLYLPSFNQMWNYGIRWTPVPLHTTPMSSDTLLYNFNICPKLASLMGAYMKSEQYKTQAERYKNIFPFLSAMTGANITSIDDVYYIYDIIHAEKAHDLPQPEWVTDSLYKSMVSASTAMMTGYINSKLAKRLTGGPLLGEMVTNMNNKLAGTNNYKLQVYSAHDLNVLALLTTMGVFNDILPPYASCVFVELHESRNTSYVRVLYRNSSLVDPYVLQVPGCGSRDYCPFNVFKNLVQTMIPIDITRECQVVSRTMDVKDSTSDPSNTLIRQFLHHDEDSVEEEHGSTTNIDTIDDDYDDVTTSSYNV